MNFHDRDSKGMPPSCSSVSFAGIHGTFFISIKAALLTNPEGCDIICFAVQHEMIGCCIRIVMREMVYGKGTEEKTAPGKILLTLLKILE